VLTLLVDPIRTDLRISDFQISILQGAAFVLFYAVCALPIGWALDRYPRRRIIFLGIARPLRKSRLPACIPQAPVI